MNPVKLHLQNFCNYVDEELDLSGIHLAALVGKNGAGKSSIIDGLLWCLFGEATKGGSKSADEYVRKVDGQMADESRVTLTFDLRGTEYKVIRHRSASKGKSFLELYQAIPGGYEPISGKTIAETQERLEKLIRMDYRTLTASSLILQGKSDTLTADMGDTERKEVLARILGLDFWDRRQELSRKRASELRATVKAQLEQAAAHERRAVERPATEAAIASREQALITAESEASAATVVANDLEAQVRQRPALEQQLREIDQQVTAQVTAQAQATRDLQETRTEITRQEALLTRPAEVLTQIPKAEADLGAAGRPVELATAKTAELDAKVRMAEGIAQQVSDLDQQVKSRLTDQQTVVMDGQAVGRDLKDQQAISARADVIRSAAETAFALATDLADMDTAAKRAAELDKQIRETEALSNQWERAHQSEVSSLQAQVTAYQQQSSTLSQVPCGSELQAACPLLSGARRAAEQVQVLTAKLDTLRSTPNPHTDTLQLLIDERDSLGYDAEAHEGIRDALKEVQADANQMPMLETAERRIAELTARKAELTQRYHVLQEEITRLQARRQEVASTSMDTNALRAQLMQAQSELRLAQGAEAAARERLAGLRQAHAEAVKQADAAVERIATLEAKAEELSDRMAQADQRMAALHQRRGDLQSQVQAISQVAQQLAIAQQTLSDARRREASIREDLGRLRQTLVEIEKAEAEAASLRAETAESDRKARLYDILDQASGKKSGVPALRIEAAVPQIEQLANDMLSRMAGGRLSLRLDTQVEGKSTGTMQEVLRITVLAGSQERKYSTFSGAERFMVDLSLRAALTKFLAHRSGAQIGIFALDEGLGALDEDNQPAVMEAIRIVAQDFEKTLVITHIPALQDAMPQRIEVTRGIDGSHIKVAA